MAKKKKTVKSKTTKTANKSAKNQIRKLAAKAKADAKKQKAKEAAAKRKAKLKKIRAAIKNAELSGVMEIHLVNINRAADLQLPVLPSTFEVQDKQNNETVTVHTIGEVTLLGKTGLRTVSLESHFPARKPLYLSGAFHDDPYTYYVDKLKKWKDAGDILEIHVTLTNIDWQCTINEFNFSEEGGSGDIKYTIALTEYKSPAGRVKKKTTTIKYTVRKKDTLKSIAKKYLGKTSYSKSIYSQNKSVIEKAWKKYAKKRNKAIQAYNKKHPRKKKKLLKLSSNKGKRLAAGTKLVIKQKKV